MHATPLRTRRILHPKRIALVALGLLAIQASVVAAAVDATTPSHTTAAESASSPSVHEVVASPAPADSPTFGRWSPSDAPAQAAPEPEPAPARSDAFATVDGFTLVLPGRDVIAIGYHEAREQHLAMTPLGAPQGNWGIGPTPAATAGYDYVIMPTREREGRPTSAVDVVLPAGSDVLSPVTGTVVSVGEYTLYDEHLDVQVQIIPDSRPDLLVTIYHVDELQVRAGQHVEAGTTVLAGSARVFDFIAQVEQWGRGPHVDLRVSRR